MNKQKINPKAIKKEADELLLDVPYGLASANLLSGLSFACFLFVCTVCQKLIAAESDVFSTAQLRFGAYSAVLLLCFVMLVPTKTRVQSWYCSLAQYKRPKLGPMHEQNAGAGALLLEMTLFVLKALWLFLFLLPSAICMGVLVSYSEKYSAAFGDSIYTMLLTAVLMLFAVGILLWSYHIQRYFLCKALFFRGEKRGCIKTSIELMKDAKEDVFELKTSFLPKFLSCLLIIPCFSVIPEYKTAMALCAAEIASRREPKVIRNEIE